MLCFEKAKMDADGFEAATKEAIKIGKEVSSDDAFMADFERLWLKNRECASRTIVYRALTAKEREVLLATCGSEKGAHKYVADCVDDGLSEPLERAVRLAIISMKGFVFQEMAEASEWQADLFGPQFRLYKQEGH